MSEHIDTTRLQSDLRYRFDYLSKFLNFTKEDITLLNSLAPIIFPQIKFITEQIYNKLYSFDVIKKYFLLRNNDFESFSSEEETNTTVISAQTDFRKDMLSVYLKKIFIQTEWNDIFLQYLSQIGEIHTESDHTESTNVDYIHVNMLLGYLESLLFDIIWKEESFDNTKKRLSIRTINKVFRIQNDFFAMHYGFSLKQGINQNTPLKKQTKCLFK
ncbi:unnamed protein product [Adineta steineri]|uniref:Globin-sensor domain-containing protein n=1 Tax=Adineta steineri TaxID=433720 RepID=A0A819ES42_9BILA|nr:unnamed protein product [Adineta steineri]CAF3854854.1 unnamed protein product [Adineta steineri]